MESLKVSSLCRNSSSEKEICVANGNALVFNSESANITVSRGSGGSARINIEVPRIHCDKVHPSLLRRSWVDGDIFLNTSDHSLLFYQEDRWVRLFSTVEESREAGPPGLPGERGEDVERGEIGLQGCQGPPGAPGQSNIFFPESSCNLKSELRKLNNDLLPWIAQLAAKTYSFLSIPDTLRIPQLSIVGVKGLTEVTGVLIENKCPLVLILSDITIDCMVTVMPCNSLHLILKRCTLKKTFMEVFSRQSRCSIELINCTISEFFLNESLGTSSIYWKLENNTIEGAHKSRATLLSLSSDTSTAMIRNNLAHCIPENFTLANRNDDKIMLANNTILG